MYFKESALHMYKFSTVSYIVILHSKLSSELTFEKFYPLDRLRSRLQSRLPTCLFVKFVGEIVSEEFVCEFMSEFVSS